MQSTIDDFCQSLQRAADAPIDEDIMEYVRGFIDDLPLPAKLNTMESLQLELIEFLGPLLPALQDSSSLDQLCHQFLAAGITDDNTSYPSLNDDSVPTAAPGTANGATIDSSSKLALPIRMQSMDQHMTAAASAGLTVPKRTGDISLTNWRDDAKPSLVDQRKLERAEQKLKDKQQKQQLKELRSAVQYVDLKQDTTDYYAMNTMLDPHAGKGKPKDIRLENFDISFGGRKILSGANLTLAHGRRYGLIGRNGIGKSTLLRHLAHRDIQSANKNGGIPEWLRILHVEQEIAGDETPALASVLLADAYRTGLLRREKELSERLQLTGGSKSDKDALSMELKDIYQRLIDCESDKAETRAATILSGLGFSKEQQQQPTRMFSGGWRMRIALARALFCKPDVLLCDEPTNHLDINAVVWLEKYLCSWPNTLVLVSHDRDFLDDVVTDVLHLHNERIDQYRGNYTMFLATRAERRRNELKEYESQRQYREHLQSFIDRWRYNAKRAAQAQSKIKILEKLPELNPPEDDGVDDGEMKFRWPDPVDKLSPPILQADEISFGYPATANEGSTGIGRLILDHVDFSVNLDSRVAIVGPNGAGKTTLLKLLIGQLDPTKGQIKRHGRLRLAYFSQHHVEALETDAGVRTVSPLELFTSKYPGQTEEEYRGVLGRFGITGQTALQPIQTLSGGQKSRVVFAMMAMNNPHILVLDEVTNHLDIMTIDSLVKAINPKTGFKGGVIVVSHDARFIDRVCNELWICTGGRLSKFKPQKGVISGDEDTGEFAGTSGISEYKSQILRELETI